MSHTLVARVARRFRVHGRALARAYGGAPARAAVAHDAAPSRTPAAGQAPAQVVICGGGIAGMTMGLACHMAGVKAVILEQAPVLHAAVGNGIGLWGPALMILRALGLEDSLTRDGRYMQCAGYRDIAQAPGDWLVAPSPMAAERASPSRRLRSCLCIRRGSLQMALLDALPRDMLRLGVRVARVVPQGVELSDGEVVRGDVVVGADGLWSRVREAVAGSPEAAAKWQPVDSGYDYWRAITTFPMRDRPPEHALAFEAWGNNRRFGMVPLANDDVFWFAVVDHRATASPAGTLPPPPDDPNATHAWLLDVFGPDHNVDPFVTSLIGATEATAIEKTPIHDMPRLPAYTRLPGDDAATSLPPTVIIGDAAHAMAPNLAQGACLAMEGAVELAAQLRRAFVTGELAGADEAIEAYRQRQSRRAFPVQVLVPMVHAIGRVSGLLRSCRNAVFKAAPGALKTPVFDSTHRWALGWNYTVPDLGQGLYARLLGARFFDKLREASQQLEQFHVGTERKHAEGHASVRVGSGLMALAARLSGLPPVAPARSRLTVDVEVDAARGRETWKRHFFGPDGAVHELCTVQWLSGEQMLEQHGPFVLALNVVDASQVDCDGRVHRLRFDHVSCGMFLGLPVPQFVSQDGMWLVPLPRFVAPVVHGTTEPIPPTEGGGWNFSVRVCAPKWTRWLSSAARPSHNSDAPTLPQSLSLRGGDDVEALIRSVHDDAGPLIACYEGVIETVDATGDTPAA